MSTGGGRVKEIIKNAKDEGRNKLLEHEAYEVLSAYGLPVPRAGLAKDPDEAVKIAESVGYPVVLKIVSPDIVHKSDVGGVKVGLSSSDEVVKAFKDIMNGVAKHAPKARVAGILVQEMVPEALEVIVGTTRDPTFGPIVLFGLGGIFVEVLKDVSFRITPVTKYDAETMLSEIKAAKILEGYRGMPPRDKEALVDMIIKISKFMEEQEDVTDVDLNPIMVFEEGKGAKIADARILIKPS
ncbi:MAG: acetate--CoA ligase family protein [Desulfurococcales archaeon]|nr:acetate--CoA ligase family protein [Desulfurococcales archaeon]